MGISKSPCPFPYSYSPYPYGNGDCSFGRPLSHALKRIFPFFCWEIDIFLRFHMGNQRTSPYGNGNSHQFPFPYGEANGTYTRFYMGIPIETGSRFRTGTIQSLTRFGIEFVPIRGIDVKITIWECFHMRNTISIWWLPYGNRQGDSNIPIWGIPVSE